VDVPAFSRVPLGPGTPAAHCGAGAAEATGGTIENIECVCSAYGNPPPPPPPPPRPRQAPPRP